MDLKLAFIGWFKRVALKLASMGWFMGNDTNTTIPYGVRVFPSAIISQHNLIFCSGPGNLTGVRISSLNACEVYSASCRAKDGRGSSPGTCHTPNTVLVGISLTVKQMFIDF